MPYAVAGRRHAVIVGRAAASGAQGPSAEPRRRASHLRRFVAIAALLVVGVEVHPVLPAQTAQQFYLTVLDRDGVPIVDLQPGDVTVTENGVPGQVMHLVRPTAAVDVFLLVDTSRNLVSATPHLRRALLGCVDTLAGSARMSLMVFGGTPRRVVAPTMRTAEMREAIARLFPSPGFNNSFQNALIEARRRIAEESPRRPVIVAVTSSVASRQPSELYVRDYLNPLTRMGTPIHIVTLRRRPGDLLGSLAEIAARTGGRFATVANHTRLDAPLAAIADEILGQYVLTYLRPELPADADPVDIRLSVAREGITIRVTPVL
ncbi:MAG: hypothetical protein F4Z60_04955 [Chloroflexi bacterium]|nr:hypothetical protein [Chloroflexota bacterium]